MPESSESSDAAEKIHEDLKPMADEVMDIIAFNQRVFETTQKELGRLAREFYPGMKNWQPEQLRKLADLISRHASKFSIELSDLDFASTKNQD